MIGGLPASLQQLVQHNCPGTSRSSLSSAFSLAHSQQRTPERLDRWPGAPSHSPPLPRKVQKIMRRERCLRAVPIQHQHGSGSEACYITLHTLSHPGDRRSRKPLGGHRGMNTKDRHSIAAKRRFFGFLGLLLASRGQCRGD